MEDRELERLVRTFTPAVIRLAYARTGNLADAEDAAGLPAAPEPEEGGLLEAVLALPVKYRTVIHLYYYEGLTTAEIAALLGKGEAAIRTRLSRARAMLREELKEDEDYA